MRLARRVEFRTVTNRRNRQRAARLGLAVRSATGHKAGATIEEWWINREHFVAVPFYNEGTSGSPLRLRDLFQEFLNLMDLAQSLARRETTRRLRLPFVGRDLILDFRMRRAGLPAKAGGFRRPWPPARRRVQLLGEF